MKATVEDEKLQGKIKDEDKQKILDKCNEIISWLGQSEKEEFEHLTERAGESLQPHQYQAVPECKRHARMNAWGVPWWRSSSLWWCFLWAHH
jgi:hypothetical protein